LQTDSILLTANWIRTGISGFGMSARLLLILFRWPTIVLKIHIKYLDKVSACEDIYFLENNNARSEPVSS
jgi:hypothetical protein